MYAHTRKAFYYHAHANALGGSLRQPLERLVSTPASVSLASAGGFSNSRVERFHVDGLISIEAAHVRVSGSEHVNHVRLSESETKEVRSWRTITAATLEGLNVLEVLTADRIVAQVSVDHPQDDGPIQITLLGSRFENLKVHGQLVRPKFDTRLLGVGRAKAPGAAPTPEASPLPFAELLKITEEQHKERSTLKLPEKVRSRFKVDAHGKDLDEKGSSLCSLVQEVEAEAPVESFSNMLHIPDFGNVFLGELLVSRTSAQLTMLRLEMGCMADGDLSACSAFSNGRTMP